MDNEPWGKDKLLAWKEFWNSEMGKEALAKMENLKEQCLQLSLQPTDPNVVAYYVGRAGGIDLVLQDIQAGIRTLDEMKEGGSEKKKK